MSEEIENIWMYSRNYGELLMSVKRLHEMGEDYAAMFLLFNVAELLMKSIRENFDENFIQDLRDLHSKGLLSDNDYAFFNEGEGSVRRIRNIMTHKDAYKYYFIDCNEIYCQFSEKELWGDIYESYGIRIIAVLNGLVLTTRNSEK